MTRIAAADQEAMNKLFTTAVASGCKTAGVAADESPENTKQVFKDHEDYIATLEDILSDDKKTSFDPNNEILD